MKMDDQQQSNPNFHRGNEHEPDQKRQKRDEIEATTTNATEVAAKSLTNIYYDCLERIFDFLDLESLLNVAGTCKRLQIAAAAKFGDDFSHKHIRFRQTHQHPIDTTGILCSQDSKFISVIALKFIFPSLRCFGSKILHLNISYGNLTNTQSNNLDRYINQYCADTLIYISFENKRSFSTEYFSKPFKCIGNIGAWGSTNLGNHLPNIVTWFPNLRTLQLPMERDYDENALAVYFPHLEHLTLEMGGSRHFLSLENAKQVLRANRHLKSLLLSCSDMTLGEIVDVIKESPFISKLIIMFGPIRNTNTAVLNRFISEHQSIVDLEFLFGLFEVDEALLLIRQLNSLKRFKFKLKDRFECDRLLSQLDERWQQNVSTGYNGVCIELNC